MNIDEKAKQGQVCPPLNESAIETSNRMVNKNPHMITKKTTTDECRKGSYLESASAARMKSGSPALRTTDSTAPRPTSTIPHLERRPENFGEGCARHLVASQQPPKKKY